MYMRRQGNIKIEKSVGVILAKVFNDTPRNFNELKIIQNFLTKIRNTRGGSIKDSYCT